MSNAANKLIKDAMLNKLIDDLKFECHCKRLLRPSVGETVRCSCGLVYLKRDLLINAFANHNSELIYKAYVNKWPHFITSAQEREAFATALIAAYDKKDWLAITDLMMSNYEDDSSRALYYYISRELIPISVRARMDYFRGKNMGHQMTLFEMEKK